MAETQKHRRPGRAAFFGLLWGLGLAIYLLFVNPVIGLDTIPSVITKTVLIIAGAVVLSVTYAFFAPAKKPKGAPPEGA